MRTCVCGNPIISRTGKVCVICRNRAIAKANRVVVDPAFFTARVDITEGGCWEWRGAKIDGYGAVGKSIGGYGEKLAHRLSYRYFVNNEIRWEIDHLCRNRPCINPEHLEDVTGKVNMSRAPHIAAQIAQTHCLRGHEFTPENTVLRPKPSGTVSRFCRACNRERSRENYIARRKAAGLTPAPRDGDPVVGSEGERPPR